MKKARKNRISNQLSAEKSFKHVEFNPRWGYQTKKLRVDYA